MWLGGVVEYIQTVGTGGVTILGVSVGWWCSGVHVRPLVLVVYHSEGQFRLLV